MARALSDEGFTDGPHLESEECISGLWIIEVTDLDVALRLAAEGWKACRGRVDVRPFQTEESFKVAARVVTELTVEEAIARAHPREWARMVATLTRRCGRPPNPGAWLTGSHQNRLPPGGRSTLVWPTLAPGG